jgi:hypothetical protein
MPVDAKAGCLYPNNARALFEAKTRGFDNCLLCDLLGNVAELATANVFLVKDGVVFTPMPNGTFLNGITRQRVIKLLREAGITVIEGTLAYREFETADEIFSTGNYSKVMPIVRIGDCSLQPGPIYRKARGDAGFTKILLRQDVGGDLRPELGHFDILEPKHDRTVGVADLARGRAELDARVTVLIGLGESAFDAHA